MVVLGASGDTAAAVAGAAAGAEEEEFERVSEG